MIPVRVLTSAGPFISESVPSHSTGYTLFLVRVFSVFCEGRPFHYPLPSPYLLLLDGTCPVIYCRQNLSRHAKPSALPSPRAPTQHNHRPISLSPSQLLAPLLPAPLCFLILQNLHWSTTAKSITPRTLPRATPTHGNPTLTTTLACP